MGKGILDLIGSPQLVTADGSNLAVGAAAGGTTRLLGKIAETSVGAMAPTGTTKDDAAITSYTHNIVSGAGSNTGVRLPASQEVGAKVYVINRGITSAVKVYPPSGGTINELAADASVTVNSGASAQFIAKTSTAWYTVSE